MVDHVQTKKDLEACVDELSKYQALSRTGLTRDELIIIDGIMKKLKNRIQNIQNMVEN